MMKPVILIASLGLAALAGCVEPTASAPQQAVPVAQAQTLSGTIVGVRNVNVPNQTNQVAGAVAGGLIGGLIGNQFGNGTGKDVMTVAGVAAGAAAGNRAAAAQSVSQEWTVRLADGRTIGVVQKGNFYVGQRVSIVVQGNSARIVA
jgi:outer membrane lipoprotein SlyB